MPSKDLWGELPEATPIRVPVAILKEQAAVLSERTDGALNYSVNQSSSAAQTVVQFFMTAPSIAGYKLHLFDLNYPLGLIYPINFIDRVSGQPKNVVNEEELLQTISDVFQSEKVRDAISKLLASVNALAD